MAPVLSKHQKIGIALSLSVVLPRKKSKRRYWVKNWLQKRNKLCHMNIMKELEVDDLRNFLRMDIDSFEELLAIVTPTIEKQDTLMRNAISARERLTATLRFLVSGQSYEDLKFSTIISPQLMSIMIPETCRAIYECLKHYIKMPSSEAEWKNTAKMFEDKWNFSHCLGAMDGKHVAVEKPPGSGSSFYNYKDFFSVVLFAVVNANYEFIYVHTGTNGSVSDGGVIQHTRFYEKLMTGQLNLPRASSLPDTNIIVPYTFVGDSAFALNRHVMKPYPFRNINHEKRIFNYRLSRAKRVVENAFGILAARFRIFRRKISVNIENVDAIVLACCALHNYLRTKSDTYITDSCVDYENTNDLTFRPGDWRSESCELVSLMHRNEKQRNDEGNNVRNKFMAYFNGQGSVPFQENMLQVI